MLQSDPWTNSWLGCTVLQRVPVLEVCLYLRVRYASSSKGGASAQREQGEEPPARWWQWKILEWLTAHPLFDFPADMWTLATQEVKTPLALVKLGVHSRLHHPHIFLINCRSGVSPVKVRQHLSHKAALNLWVFHVLPFWSDKGVLEAGGCSSEWSEGSPCSRSAPCPLLPAVYATCCQQRGWVSALSVFHPSFRTGQHAFRLPLRARVSSESLQEITIPPPQEELPWVANAPLGCQSSLETKEETCNVQF